jgi:hypothetical protein
LSQLMLKRGAVGVGGAAAELFNVEGRHDWRSFVRGSQFDLADSTF